VITATDLSRRRDQQHRQIKPDLHDRPMLRGSYSWQDSERLIRFGDDALDQAPALLAERGFEGYALLTTERALASVPLLGETADRVLNVPPGPVPDAAAAVRDAVDGRPLVALGGGRVIDAAKAIGGADGLPVAAIPTTLSGAEMTPFHRMPAGVEEFRLVRPALVIAAPSLMASAPLPDLTASAMNALAHAIEALYAPMAGPASEQAALGAIADINFALRQDPVERTELARGALLAGYASGIAGFAVHHVVCQTIVRLTGSPHARTNAVMLPHFVRMMESRAPGAIADVSTALGVEPDPPAAADAIAELTAKTGVTRLSQLGVKPEQLDAVVEAALAHPAIGNTPQPPDAAELRAVLERAL
jgi:alcohol dehydrogenase class IV